LQKRQFAHALKNCIMIILQWVQSEAGQLEMSL